MVKDAVPLEQCGRALVVKLGRHGDVLLAAPVLSALKSRGVEADALVHDDTAPMLEGHPALAQLHLVGENWRALGLSRISLEKKLLKELRARRYGLLVHLSAQPRGAWLARLLGVRYSVAANLPGRGRLWARSFTHLYPIVPRRDPVEVNLDALRRIGLHPDMAVRRLHFVPGAGAEKRVATLVGGPFIHLHPVSRRHLESSPPEECAALIDRLAADGFRVVVTAAPDAQERAFVDAILAKAKAKPVNLAGQLSIKELGALTARASLFVGVESMPMHLARAMGTPTVALFGPSPVEAVHAALREPLTT